ncbi:hypothetical protein [Leifsonia sp. NCR5]|uniref:hypothetical protein n=1 Tax=Leifsonia sp. NCR5 TaxID=1978342 RepID=UPI000A197E13|nr:hypothetical protein [Leifsonia sp. NCR5]
MVTPISEEQARAALRDSGSDAAAGANYAATRRENGWSFAWRRELGEPPVGSPRWIVADNGAVRRLRLRERADDVIAAELEK